MGIKTTLSTNDRRLSMGSGFWSTGCPRGAQVQVKVANALLNAT